MTMEIHGANPHHLMNSGTRFRQIYENYFNNQSNDNLCNQIVLLEKVFSVGVFFVFLFAVLDCASVAK